MLISFIPKHKADGTSFPLGRLELPLLLILLTLSLACPSADLFAHPKYVRTDDSAASETTSASFWINLEIGASTGLESHYRGSWDHDTGFPSVSARCSKFIGNSSLGVGVLFEYQRCVLTRTETSGNLDFYTSRTEGVLLSGSVQIIAVTNSLRSSPSFLFEIGAGGYIHALDTSDPGVHIGSGLIFDVDEHFSITLSSRIQAIMTGNETITWISVSLGIAGVGRE